MDQWNSDAQWVTYYSRLTVERQTRGAEGFNPHNDGVSKPNWLSKIYLKESILWCVISSKKKIHNIVSSSATHFSPLDASLGHQSPHFVLTKEKATPYLMVLSHTEHHPHCLTWDLLAKQTSAWVPRDSAPKSKTGHRVCSSSQINWALLYSSFCG